MSNSYQTFIQLIIVAMWVVLLVYSFSRKFQYMSIWQKVLLPMSTLTFCIFDTTMFNYVDFKNDWYSDIFYISQVFVVMLLAVSFNLKETQYDENI